MGTQEGEREWTDVANNLLIQCHIGRRLRRLADCDADVFIALYENILGEKVPDYIAAPTCQEDDIHNVQSVIDSLSLDYLQISLSHITGENVIRGDKDSIKNLLEIFDGLLEYLKEEIIDGPNNEEAFDNIAAEAAEPRARSASAGNRTQPEQSSPSTGESPVASSKHSLHPPDAEEQGSDSELLGLGASAHTFAATQEAAAATSCPPDDRDGAESPAPRTATALQPPKQSHGPPAAGSSSQEPAGQEDAESSPPAAGGLLNGLQSPAATGRSLSCQLRPRPEEEEEEEETTLEDERAAASLSPPDSSQEEENQDTWATHRQVDARTGHRYKRSPRRRLQEESREGSPSHHGQKNAQAEEELHQISEKLSHRLEELDQMLKRVLGESGESAEGREEDRWARPTTEGRRAPRPPADSESTHRTGSSSPCSSRGPSSLQDRVGGDPTPRQEDGTGSVLAASPPSRQDQHHRRAHRKHKHRHSATREDEASERRRDEGQAHVDEARLKAQEAERQYREAILRDVPQARAPPRSRIEAPHPVEPPPSGRRRPEIARPPSMKVKENGLLPLLLEELPHLDVCSRAQGRMWRQQQQQVDGLRSAASPSSRRRGKLTGQLEEAQRKHDLLVEILHKDQEHKRRLRELKEHSQQQKSIQNRAKEQRQQAARARKYYNDYHVQHRARLTRTRTREEKMFRQLFEEGLELQKVRLREQRAHAREQRQEQQRRYQDQVTSLENYYKDQFSILAEKLAQERQEVQVQKKAQEKVLLKMKRELRSRMEHEIQELQKMICRNDEDDFIQGAEVQRLRQRMQMASFHFNTSYLQ